MNAAPNLFRPLGLVPLVVVLGCGSGGGAGYNLDVGSDDGGASLALGAAGDASVSGFDAHIEQNHITVTFVTIGCSGPCADVVAVPTGGYAPYTFKWNDGTTSAARTLCPTASTGYSVKVTDTGTSGELARRPETVNVPLAANVAVCPDAGMADAGAPDTGLPACPAGFTGIDAGTVTPDYLDNVVAYFADGGALPAGHYSVSYVSGCMKYNGYSNFTINGQSTFEYLIVGADASGPIAVAPGTVALGIPFGYADIASCEAANRALPPVDFDFDGGLLGIYNNDFQPSDNVIDPTAGAPTWRLSGGCQ